MKTWTSIFTVLCILGITAADAAVVQRGTGTVARPTATTTSARGSAAATTRQPTMSTNMGATQTTQPTVAEEVIVEEIVEAIIEEPTVVIENKSSQFAAGMNNTTSGDIAGDERAEMIRRQRAALDAAEASETAQKTIQAAIAGNNNACDKGLRDCMRGRCKNDFSDCAGDTDTIWGNKLESCRRDLNCTSEEFTLFAREIKADRDHNSQLASYNEVLTCGNSYNACIFTECGVDLSKCLAKSVADAAVSKCSKIANDCRAADSGLANRVGQVFGTLRTNATAQVRKDEDRLYELRSLMSNTCQRLGAMFDERSLDCVFTVNFFAGEKNTLFASKKLYAGDTFDCTQNWFGIDTTTYKENAYRLTRSQTAASSSFAGAGLGVAAGAISSGAINRAIDSHKAERAVGEAECEAGGGEWKKAFGTCKCKGEGQKWDKKNKNCVNRKSDDPASGDDENYIYDKEIEGNNSDIDNDNTLSEQEKAEKKAARKQKREDNKAERQAEKEEKKLNKQLDKDMKATEKEGQKAIKDAEKADKKAKQEAEKEEKKLNKQLDKDIKAAEKEGQKAIKDAEKAAKKAERKAKRASNSDK